MKENCNYNACQHNGIPPDSTNPESWNSTSPNVILRTEIQQFGIQQKELVLGLGNGVW